MLSRALPFALAAALVAPTAARAEGPATTPTRDVDVVYEMQLTSAQADSGGVARQRMRWSVAAGRERVDPPAPGMYMIVDYRNRQMMVVRDDTHSVVKLDATGPQFGLAAPGRAFVREGGRTVAGLACTDWRTSDSSGASADVCITDDGVLLRAAHGDKVLVQAVSVRYEPQEKALFDPPAGYTVLTKGSGG